MIVVGIDGSTGAAQALRFAVDEARLRGTGVLAVHAWALPMVVAGPGLYAPPMSSAETLQEETTASMERFLADELAGADDVTVQLRVVQGHAGEELVDAAREAEMLVVGSRGHGELASLLLGSVSHHCAQHAACPVVIVRAES